MNTIIGRALILGLLVIVSIENVACQQLRNPPPPPQSQPKQSSVLKISLLDLFRVRFNQAYEIPDWWFNPGKGMTGLERRDAIRNSDEIWDFLMSVANDELFQDTAIMAYQPAAVLRVRGLLAQLRTKGSIHAHVTSSIARLIKNIDVNSPIIADIIVDLLWESVRDMISDVDINQQTADEANGRLMEYLREFMLNPTLYSETNALIYSQYKTHVIVLATIEQDLN